MIKTILLFIIFVSSLYASKDELVINIMENAGINKRIYDIKIKILNDIKSKNKSKERQNKYVIDFKNFYNIEEIKHKIENKLIKQLSLKDLKFINNWYKSPLAKNIKKANETTITEKVALKIINDVSIFRDKKHVFILADINYILRYSYSDYKIFEKLINIQLKKYPNFKHNDMIELYKKDKKLLEKRFRNRSIAFFAYAYQNINTEDLDKYANFLFTKRSKKFINIYRSSLSNYINETIEKIRDDF